MNHNHLLAHKFHILLAVLLLAVLAGCQAPAATVGPSATTAASTPGSPVPQKTGIAAATPGPTGAWSLLQTNAGLEALTSYHQSYTYSMKGAHQGKPYEVTTTEERTVSGQDESSLVNSMTSGAKPFYLQLTRSGGQTYVQQKAGQTCRAPDPSDNTDQNLTPAEKLLPVFNGTKVGSETLGGIPAVHYRFDASAVRRQAGKNGTAEGEVWVAQDGGVVLKYQLTIQVKEGDFTGTRAWTYALSDVNQAAPVALPEGCLPVLSDVPALPGASDVVSIPGFVRYSANSSITAAVKFYQERLPAKSWYLLPGDEPQPASARLKFARSMPDGSGQALVIQLAAQDAGLQVVIQVLKTDRPIQPAARAAAGATPPAEGATETPEPATAALPAGLPVYPGAKVLMQDSQVLMCQAAAPLDEVAKYYRDQMAAAGWSLAESNVVGGVTTQKWEKDGASVMVILNFQDNQTQVVISPQ